MNCFLKSFITKKLNKLLDEYKDKVQESKKSVDLWLSRAEQITNCLKSLSEKLDDNKIDDKEIEETVSQIKALVEGWK